MIRTLKSLFEIKMFKSAIALTGGRFFNLAVSIVLLLIQSRYIGPDITGFCQAFSIPMGYLWIMTLGVASALARELPYYLARGERDTALRLTQTAQSFSIVMGGVCASFFALLATRAAWRGDYLSMAGWSFQIINGFLVIYDAYLKTLYRTNDEFVKIAKANTFAAVAHIVTFPLIFWNPYLGIWTKYTTGTVATDAYLYWQRPFKFSFKIDLEPLKALIKFGMPLIAIGYIEAALWTSVQLSMVYKMGGATYLGLFTFINSILLPLLIIPNAVADILRPRFAAVYGESDGDMRRTLTVAVKPLMIAMAVSVPALVIAWLFVDDIIVWLLPKYTAAIPGIGIALLLIPVMTVHCIKYVFVVCKNMHYNLLSTAPGFLVGIALLYLFLSKGIGFKYIFLPYLIGQVINLLISVFFITRLSNKKELVV